MCAPIARPAKRMLHQPALGAAFDCIKKRGFLVNPEEDFLNDFLGFAFVAHDSQRDSEDQSGVPGVEQVEPF